MLPIINIINIYVKELVLKSDPCDTPLVTSKYSELTINHNSMFTATYPISYHIVEPS